MEWCSFVPLLILLAVPRSDPPSPLVHTYSIVARDPATGEMGVAVQSHYFSVGPIVPWAEAGVGAVATQSLVLVDYGPKGLDLMRGGLTAQQALDSLVRTDAHSEGRQVAMVDARGTVAVHTGPSCIPDAGHQQGANYSVQANLMANATVWPAMAKAYEAAQGDLAERMMQALEAAERAGGDIRGQQSAAILIVKAQSTGKPWMDRVMDLRVEDHEEPLKELRRLIRLRRAYNLEDQGDTYISEKKPAEAMKAYEEAARLAPDVVELQFWAAVSMYTNDRKPEALKLFRTVFARDRRWVDLIPRLAKAGLFPNDPAQIEEVQRLRPRSRMDRGR
ncbi:MAG TPA: DUF1028 domain-containing protein [Candidatus Limnocylindria bacterium]|nr:DUF1028 domain-containing protein [Candidatus Limnocylindria bacterium]